MIRTVGLSLALLFGLSSVIVVVAAPFQHSGFVQGTESRQRTDANAKADRLQVADDGVSDSKIADSEADRAVEAASRLAPIIFAQPSGVAGPLLSAVDGRENAAEVSDNSWRNAKAEASAKDTQGARPARKAVARKLRTQVAPERTAPERKACVQPTGFNAFLASVNLKPHCET